MKDYFKKIAEEKALRDIFIYGYGVKKTIERKKYNPLRYLIGKSTNKRISPKKLYKLYK